MSVLQGHAHQAILGMGAYFAEAIPNLIKGGVLSVPVGSTKTG